MHDARYTFVSSRTNLDVASFATSSEQPFTLSLSTTRPIWGWWGDCITRGIWKRGSLLLAMSLILALPLPLRPCGVILVLRRIGRHRSLVAGFGNPAASLLQASRYIPFHQPVSSLGYASAWWGRESEGLLRAGGGLSSVHSMARLREEMYRRWRCLGGAAAAEAQPWVMTGWWVLCGAAAAEAQQRLMTEW